MAIITNILKPQDYPAIRFAIDQRLTDKNLPDSKIGLPIFMNKTDRWVSKSLGTVEPDLEDDFQLALVKEAAVYYAASLMIMKVVDSTQIRVQARDYSSSKNAWNIDDKEEELKGAADQAIQDLIDYIKTGDFSEDISNRVSSVFTSVTGQRARI